MGESAATDCGGSHVKQKGGGALRAEKGVVQEGREFQRECCRLLVVRASED